MLKNTPLKEEHIRLGAKFMLFYGWKLPLEFSQAKAEHLNVRKNAGLFDVSHMGEIRVRGKEALALLEKCLSNNVARLKKNRVQYNFLCNEQGGVIDDLMLYCLKEKQDYLLCVNASRTEVDLEWLQKHNSFSSVKVEDESSKWAQLALQGPKSFEILSSVLEQKNSGGDIVLKKIKKNDFQWGSFKGETILVSATGYTGEKGFEIFISPKKVGLLWRTILEEGQSKECLPVGLAARDTLRMEMKYPLYGKDLNEKRDPHSAGLSWAVKNPGPFIGSEALKKIKKNIKTKWVGFKLFSDSSVTGVPRMNNRILGYLSSPPMWEKADEHLSISVKKIVPVGEVTGGALSPSLGEVIGLGYVPLEYVSQGQKIYVEVHQTPVPAKVVTGPFLK